jgi:hypothetical protein
MEEQPKTVDVNYGPCCFCGDNILPTAIDPCQITVETTSGSWQVWFCHGNCFKERLVKHSQIDLSPAHF